MTLYIPSETPPEVIDYLNCLKQEGTFSQGVVEIVTRYVQQQQSVSIPPAPTRHAADIGSDVPDFDTSLGSFHDRLSTPLIESAALMAGTKEPVAKPSQVTSGSAARNKFNLTEIFRQAQRNSGKMIDSKENN